MRLEKLKPFAWWADQMVAADGWRYSVRVNGGPFVTMTGRKRRQMWSADSWDSQRPSGFQEKLSLDEETQNFLFCTA